MQKYFRFFGFLTVLLIALLVLGANIGLAGDVTLKFAWDQSDFDRVTGWELEVAEADTGPWTLLAAIPKQAGGPAFTADAILTSPDGQKKTWWFRLKAHDAQNNLYSAYSTSISHEVDFTPLPAPQNFTFTVVIVPE